MCIYHLGQLLLLCTFGLCSNTRLLQKYGRFHIQICKNFHEILAFLLKRQFNFKDMVKLLYGTYWGKRGSIPPPPLSVNEISQKGGGGRGVGRPIPPWSLTLYMWTAPYDWWTILTIDDSNIFGTLWTLFITRTRLPAGIGWNRLE